MTKITKKKVLFAVLIILAAAFCTAAAADAGSTYAEEIPETIEFQVLATGDIHGQVTSTNYETGLLLPNYGLTKISTLISKARKALPEGNTILIDAGDTLYDYSTNYFYNDQPGIIQPVYLVMSALNYDCITLGNHELDYPWDYITTQLKGASLYDKVVVSNLTYTDSAETVFAPSMIITKEVTTSKGDIVTIRVGVVGATRKGISTRRQYYGFLTSGDIYSAVSAEAKRLKKTEKVDLVIALVHGGIGLLSGSDTNTHPGARLAKSSYIDGVVTAHTHEAFPLNNGTYSDAAYINIVDEEKGLIYNTPVAATGCQGSALGVLSYTLIINDDGSYSIDSAYSKLQKSSKSVSESKAYTKIFDKYLTMLRDAVDKTEYPIAKGQFYTNIDCFIQDNDLYQLFNNSKIQYGHNYIHENYPEYESLPVIACTANILDSTETDIIITDLFNSDTVAHVRSEQSVTRDSGYVTIFKITGYQLREWLEYNASIYATAGEYTFEEFIPGIFSKKAKPLPLLQGAYFDDHSKFYVFDGISYTIDISKRARYFANGKMVSSLNKRISSLTYNGVDIKDNQEFIIVTDAFDVRYSFMPENSQSLFTVNPWVTSKEIAIDYIRQLSLLGPIQIKADNNWKITAPSGYQFAVGMPYYVRPYIESKEWFTSYALTNKAAVNYPVFYKGTFEKASKLKQGLNVILSVSKTKQTAFPVEVYVTAAMDSKVKIKQMKYLKGIYNNAEDEAWDSAVKIKNNKFKVSENGTYTVFVKDSLGNVSINVVVVDNINPEVLDAPVCNNFTNRQVDITGRSIAKAIVYAKLSDGSVYSATADSKGAFSITVPVQRAYDLVNVYAELKGIRSIDVEVIVRRTGPDMPEISSDISSATNTFSGFLDPYSFVYLRYGNTVYVGQGMTAAYTACDYYKDTYTVVEADIRIEVIGDIAYFTAVIPKKIAKDKTVYVYAVDKNSKSSRARSVTIGQAGDVNLPDTGDDAIPENSEDMNDAAGLNESPNESLNEGLSESPNTEDGTGADGSIDAGDVAESTAAGEN